jgi:basic membrane protein A
MSTDIGGVNDESFNASAWAGLQRAQNELGVSAHMLNQHQKQIMTETRKSC